MKLMTPPEPKYRLNIKDFSFETINSERKNKSLIHPLAEIKKTNPKEISPFAGRESINKLNEVVISSKKKGIVFRDKYIGKLDSLAKAQYFTSDYVCNLTHLLNCPMCICHSLAGQTKPVEGKIYEKMGGFKWYSQCGGYTFTSRDIITYHYPDLTEAQLLDLFNIAMLEGYYGKKVFYEAVYDEVTITDATPDYRNTLLWKPEIITNEQGEATVQFFCSDINSLFLGNIEGVSANGLLGTGNFEFKVRKKEN